MNGTLTERKVCRWPVCLCVCVLKCISITIAEEFLRFFIFTLNYSFLSSDLRFLSLSPFQLPPIPFSIARNDLSICYLAQTMDCMSSKMHSGSSKSPTTHIHAADGVKATASIYLQHKLCTVLAKPLGYNKDVPISAPNRTQFAHLLQCTKYGD